MQVLNALNTQWKCSVCRQGSVLMQNTFFAPTIMTIGWRLCPEPRHWVCKVSSSIPNSYTIDDLTWYYSRTRHHSDKCVDLAGVVHMWWHVLVTLSCWGRCALQYSLIYYVNSLYYHESYMNPICKYTICSNTVACEKLDPLFFLNNSLNIPCSDIWLKMRIFFPFVSALCAT